MNPAALVKGPATINVDLPPAALATPAAGVASALSKRLLRWCPDLGGVLLSYGSVELVGSHSGKSEGKNGTREGAEGSSAEISDYFGFVRVAAAVGDALVFAPTPGMRLEGTVARVGGDYVGVLALGVFSAAVGGAALSGRFDLEDVAVEEAGEAGEAAGAEEEEVAAAAAAAANTAAKTPRSTTTKEKTVTRKAWVCKADRSHRLVEGARVLFDVARVRRSDGGFVSISGSLESASSGVVGARGVGAAAAATAAPASVSAPAAKKSKSSKGSIPSAPAADAANGSSKRKKAEAGSAEKKEPKKEKEPKAKKAKTSKKK